MPGLFAASISNEGKETVKVNARSAQGIMGGGSLKPGQSLPVKSDVLWIEHVPEGRASGVSLRITEDDGRSGFINTPGGRYAFQRAVELSTGGNAEKKISSAPVPGYAENQSNTAMLLSLIDRRNKQSYSLLLPGQKSVIPQDTVKVISDRHGWSSGDVKIALFLIMPDGKQRMIRDEHAETSVDTAAAR